MNSRKIAIVSNYPEEGAALFRSFSEIEIVADNPDLVVSYGGDGTLMRAEHEFPNVPKLFLKKSRVGKLAQHDDNALIIKKFLAGDFILEEHQKLEAVSGERRVVGLNDIVIHNTDPRHAIRYRVKIDGRSLGEEIIGDGVVIATPLGSTGYYRSITGSYFESGIGIAFNNSTEQSDHVVLRTDRVATVEILRGPAKCYADNQKELIELMVGDRVTIKVAQGLAKIFKIKI